MKYLFIPIILLFVACGGGSDSENTNNSSETNTTIDTDTNIVDNNPQEYAIAVKKTGQTISYANYDDGYYKKGIKSNIKRDSVKEVVIDYSTKLMWQDDSTSHENNSDKKVNTAAQYCENLNLANYTNWRLPSIQELISTIDLNESTITSGYKVKTNMFENVWGGYDYLSQSDTSYSGSLAKSTVKIEYNGFSGNVSSTTIGDFSINVRCVRSLSNFENISFTRDNTKEVVVDNIRNNMWQDDVDAKRYADSNNNLIITKWNDALNYCENSSLAGYTDWRLPNVNEFYSLMDYSKSSPSFTLQKEFQNHDSLGQYWTSSTAIKNNTPYRVSFNYHHLIAATGDEGYKVRCIRDDNNTSNEKVDDNVSSSIDIQIDIVDTDPKKYALPIKDISNFSYSKLYSKEVVVDNDTKLMWQDKLSGETPTYKFTHEDAITHCEDSNHSSYNNWRLPTINEFYSLINLSPVVVPSGTSMMEHQMFEYPLNWVYWTSMEKDANNAYYMDKLNYSLSTINTNSYALKCVRSLDTFEQMSFSSDTNKKVVVDNTRELTWQDDASVNSNTFSRSDAISHCNNLELSGITNFRLPKVHEILSINNINNSTYHQAEFVNAVDSNSYWALNIIDTSNYTYFRYGRINTITSSSTLLNVRCVSDNN